MLFEITLSLVRCPGLANKYKHFYIPIYCDEKISINFELFSLLASSNHLNCNPLIEIVFHVITDIRLAITLTKNSFWQISISNYKPTLFESLKSLEYLNPNWHEGGHFPPPCLFWIRFCQLSFYQNFSNINRFDLTPYQAHWVL